MSDTPTRVPDTVVEIFERVRNEQHPSLKDARIPLVFAEKKQTTPVKLRRETSPEMRKETGVDGVLIICPTWFSKNNPAQTAIGGADNAAKFYREIDLALMGVGMAATEDGGGLTAKRPELEGLHKAEAMRYGVKPRTQAAEVVEVLIKRHEQGLEYGEALPDKHDPSPQEALHLADGDCEASGDADGDSEAEVDVDPPEEDTEAPVASGGTPIEDFNPADPFGAGRNLG